MTNYFELFEMPVTFAPDPTLIKKKYYELSRKYHPDKYVNEATENHNNVLQLAANINEGYNVLSNKEATMAHILKLHQQLEDEEKYVLPQAFLMEMMDLNEMVQGIEQKNLKLLSQAQDALKEQFDDWEQKMKQLTNRYEAGEKNLPVMMKIKDFYFRKKYLLRIKERIDNFALPN